MDSNRCISRRKPLQSTCAGAGDVVFCAGTAGRDFMALNSKTGDVSLEIPYQLGNGRSADNL